MNLLLLTFIFPLLGFILLAGLRDQISEKMAAIIGVGSMALSALTALYVGIDFLNQGTQGGYYHQILWTWMQIGSFAPSFGLQLDGLSLVMMGMITGVGFFIHLFAAWYMRGEEGFARFFSYFNLFVASMLLLVLGDNLLVMFLGWEGVGLCSYLLIGFYFKNPDNGFAAIKAFTVTRVGDVLLLIGLFILFQQFGTLDIYEITIRAPEVLTSGSPAVTWAALMLLGGAVGKSAQLPLQTWLADAMAGPTPVSALIHAATMVTAGVYLIARMHPVFELAPDVLYLVGVIGAITLLMAGFAALVQTDIKRVLAYSTMSQLGYMFLALGAEAYQAAVFHMLTHAFFKALLFLSSGAVIIACHHEQNILKMGGLWKKIPFVYLCFLVGGGALAAFPFITVGFYSKDEILWQAWASGHPELFWAGVVGAFLTSIYTFRLIWLVFHGQEKTHAHKIEGITYWLPLGVLLVLSTCIGALLQHPVGHVLNNVLPEFVVNAAVAHDKHFVEYTAVGVALLGLVIGAVLFAFNYRSVQKMANTSFGAGVAHIWRNAWGFDALYHLIFVKPYLMIARIFGRDPVDRIWGVFPVLVRAGNSVATNRQTGSLRGYAAAIVIGAVILLMILIVIQVLGK
ncbi:NADH-quinone oxidoreductase subunit L [Alkanindiges hydrocarboniclasticus]|uniref:NADH-quinone oxidoreductase subunit L n=1 Tax=Alkanindiges hydrocarboniclasticus TaxID=1907941 RepID=A0A1S8CTN0_9GAMM|nr:NADH-quinone oxidoreductase subunit L [Alkanindiges hydrocarboniclasticus]ONG39527.1 NADH-quinone oxidoreductase subunit L [Alkanindiges hydrocarboniclasticus]